MSTSPDDVVASLRLLTASVQDLKYERDAFEQQNREIKLQLAEMKGECEVLRRLIHIEQESRDKAVHEAALRGAALTMCGEIIAKTVEAEKEPVETKPEPPKAVQRVEAEKDPFHITGSHLHSEEELIYPGPMIKRSNFDVKNWYRKNNNGILPDNWKQYPGIKRRLVPQPSNVGTFPAVGPSTDQEQTSDWLNLPSIVNEGPRNASELEDKP